MAEPLEFRIVQHLQEALRSAVGDGYFYDVRGTAVKLNPDYEVEPLVEEDAPRPWVTVDVPASGEWIYQPAMRVKRVMAVRVHWFNECDPTADEDARLMCYRAYADIERAVTREVTRGGLASDTRIVEQVAVIQGTSVWVAVDLSIQLIRVFGEASV